ncbi:Mg-protoporphyrin IX methyl transferase [Clostridiales bacterium CHKCI006]|nr:Mg-protoporphyrin IX methyl transferase [Clostridiales bacterium CHKCI006]
MSYNQFAWYYDSLMEPQFYLDYFHFINRQTTYHQVLELGCGTGSLAVLLADRASQIDATDISEEMLAIAAKKHPHAHIRYQQLDMCKLDCQENYDLVLCLCDSLNYVKGLTAQLDVLHRAYQAIKPGGTLIFDVNSMHKLEVTQTDYREEQEDEDFYFYWHSYRSDVHELSHLVVIEDLNSDERMEEKQTQYVYELKDYLAGLQKLSWQSIAYYSDFERYDPQKDRIQFVCRKEG